MIPDPAAAATAAEALANRLRSLADGMDAAADVLPGATSGWSGPAAALAARLLAIPPERFRVVAVASRTAATALSRYAEALGPAIALSRQAQQAPVELAAALERQANGLVEESARQATGSLLALADSVPSRPDGWRGRLQRVDQWRAEMFLGAVESTESLAATTVKFASAMTDPFRRSPFDVPRIGMAIAGVVRRPREFGKALLDWDTWRTNPARAAGHLVPDATAAAASGGTAAGVRATTIAGQSRAAAGLAAARDSLRREATREAAAAARQALIQLAEGEAAKRMKSGGARPPAWQGADGTRLSAQQNAGIEAYHAITAVRERSLTSLMQDLSRAAQGELFGLEHRLKTPESAKRKVAVENAGAAGWLPDLPLSRLLAKVEDAVRYSVVLGEAQYVRGVGAVAAALERHGFHAQPPHNAWHGPRYRGINSVWLDPTTGTAFEVQFHTPASYRTTKQTHGLYEEYRLPGISPERKAELHELIAAQYRKVPVPGWAGVVQGKNFPPPSAPDPFTPPRNYTVPGASGAAAVAHPAASDRR